MDQIGSNRAFSVSTCQADTTLTYIIQLPAHYDLQELTVNRTFYLYRHFVQFLIRTRAVSCPELPKSLRCTMYDPLGLEQQNAEKQILQTK